MEGYIKILENSDKSIMKRYLEKNNMETTFLWGNVIQFPIENDKNTQRCGEYYGYFEDDKLKGVIAFYNLGSCIPHFESEKAIPYFMELMKKKEFKYLLGMKRVVLPFVEEVKKSKGIIKYDESNYYINDKFNPFKLENIQIKDSKELDFEKAIEFIIKCRKEGFDDKDYTREEAIKSLREASEEECKLFLIVNGEIASMCNIQTTTKDINQIGSVYTVNKYRSRGYCKAVVSEICKRILSRGKIPTLIVKKDNVPAVKAYQSIGFKYYDEYLIIKLG